MIYTIEPRNGCFNQSSSECVNPNCTGPRVPFGSGQWHARGHHSYEGFCDGQKPQLPVGESTVTQRLGLVWCVREVVSPRSGFQSEETEAFCCKRHAWHMDAVGGSLGALVNQGLPLGLGAVLADPASEN